MTFKIVYIEWVDSEVQNQWTDRAEILAKDLDLLHAVGFLIEETSESFILAGMWDQSNDSMNAVQSIPKGCVKRVRRLWIPKSSSKNK